MTDINRTACTFSRPALNANTLKLIAVLAMVLDHAATVFLADTAPAALFFHAVGQIAAPIMCFFVAEGYAYIVEKLHELGLEFTEEDIKPLFAKFKSLADKKHEITDADIRALVAGTAVENPEGFQFNDLRLSTNADETITAAVSLRNEEGEVLEFLANGQGSVEAIFNAIDKFFNQTVRLTSYNIDAVTDGIDAQARVLVSVENVDTDTIFNASGLDFDVLKASAIAYINANTLVQKENAGEMGRAVSYRDLPQA